MRQLDEEVARKLAARALGTDPARMERMPGGASTRVYLRAERDDDGDDEIEGRRSVVLMFVPDARPDEVTSGAVRDRWPFLEVRDLLATRGVQVPTIVGEHCEDGFIVLEDLGDETLAVFLSREPGAKEAIYRRAVRDLALAQSALARLPDESVVATRAFDEALLLWEIDHYREWALEARGTTLPDADRAAWDAIADRLARRVAEMPRTFVHRDYQSRNLMVKRNGGRDPDLVWIDFQDALLGPRVYDLVALLGDSYQTFERDFIEARLDDYAIARGLDAEERVALGREFDLVTVQRKLKDAGRFVFIDRKKGNPDFLKFVEPTIEKVRAALARLEDDEDMRALSGILARAHGW
jgi:aminoglycoside/choline kinase family phosphotransferase